VAKTPSSQDGLDALATNDIPKRLITGPGRRGRLGRFGLGNSSPLSASATSSPMVKIWADKFSPESLIRIGPKKGARLEDET
jgi:hypothetical protein